MKKSSALRKKVLEDRLVELGQRLGVIEEELDSHHDPDWSELAVQREGDEVLEATGRASQAETAMIESALKRIAEGTYGECARCGGAIAEPRLDAVPWTPLCQACAT